MVNNYVAGRRIYKGGATAPNVGPVANKAGYAKRDAERKAAAQMAAMKKKCGGKC